MRFEELQDREWVERFWKNGDESAFRLLYRRHTPLVYRVAHRMVGDKERAAEVVQEMWICAAQKLPEFRWESRLSTWLVGIAINLSREELRRGKNTEPIQDDVVDTARSVHFTVRVDLERAIQQLPRGYREILLLHDVEGYTHEEIGQALDIEAGTSRSQLTRARATMRAWFERKGKE